jgi:hypothetical protein
MDASGLAAFSALWLFPWIGLVWCWEGLSRAEMGFVWSALRHYVPALLHPVLVLGLAALAGWITGAVEVEKTHWRKAWLNVALVTVSTIRGVIITEEGFFRGWVWAALKYTGQNGYGVLVWSSLAFALWHWSAVLLEAGFNPALGQVLRSC